ncbi:hypothetical protein AB1L05_23725 [Cytobacillus horneckiae]|uniref:hypothetical protein n=1 Tax=Cytobacillus horneckiae TaxID=549687 RepID=UPI00203C7485|nr:hypothetical protein [Cytobacillus horneckiae]MCM3181068.1 hypothetical protein [Cytobacillus horneckiae]
MSLVILEAIKTILAYLLSIQIMYGFLILILGNVMSNFYSAAIFQEPSNVFQKSSNVFMALTIGSGYMINLKLMKYSWFIRKVLFLLALIIQGILSIIIYQVVYGSLKILFY